MPEGAGKPALPNAKDRIQLNIRRSMSGGKGNRLPYCEARAVIDLIGFTGLKHFAKTARLNHVTAAELLGIQKMKYHKHHYNLIIAHETLNTAYHENRSIMSPRA